LHIEGAIIEREDVAVRFPRVPKTGRNGGKRGAALSCRELPRNARNGQMREAAVSCHEMQETCSNEMEGGYERLPLAAMRCQKLAEMGGGGTFVNCRA
jgi:hypothetical protein